MAKELTEQEKKQIKDAVIASCISKGIKPTMVSGGYTVANPLYTSCVQLGYTDALKHASQGKLGLWFSKVNSFVQSQGGVTGLLQSVSSLANQYKAGTPGVQDGQPTGQPTGYGEPFDYTQEEPKSSSTGLWLVLIVLLLVLIVASVIYFSKKGKTA